MTPRPKPVSDVAIAQGCACPVLDNGHGQGFSLDGRLVWWVNVECPMHGGGSDWELTEAGAQEV